MVRTLKSSLISERFIRPRAGSAQQTIPIDKVFENGIWKVNRKFSRTWQFTDINYSVASDDDKMDMFLGYSGILNSLPTDATTKLTIFNRRRDKQEFARSILIPEQGNGLDRYRGEINGLIMNDSMKGSGIVRDKYITISADKRSIKDAQPYFNRIENDLIQSFGKVSSGIRAVDLENRLKLIHDFFRIGEESDFRFDLETLMKRGHSFKDLICPYAIQFMPGHFTIGEKFGRVLFLRDYSSYIKDDMISGFTDLPIDMMLSIDILPVPTEEAVKEMQKQILVVESNVARWQRRQNANNNFHATVPYEMEQMRGVVHEYLDDLTSRDQRLMFGLVTLVHLADSKEQLDIDTETIEAIAQKYVCTMSNLYAQQEPGLNTVLPYGIRPIEAVRTLTTESTGILMPFNCQEIMDEGGLYYGQNVLSRNPIICDRSKLQNPHAWILGVSGSGKSLLAKFLIAQIILSTNADVIALDPENEYSPLIRAMGGVAIDVSASSPNHINALDINSGYGGDDDPIIAKSEFVLSLCEIIMNPRVIEATEKSIIDRCTRIVYDKYRKKKYKGEPPTFKDFYDVLLQQPQPEAQDIALAIELFTTGSLNVFSRQSNVDNTSRLVSSRWTAYSTGYQRTGPAASRPLFSVTKWTFSIRMSTADNSLPARGGGLENTTPL